MQNDGDPISEYAEQRREEISRAREQRHDALAKKQSAQGKEKHLLSIEHSEVAYTIKPRSLPFSMIDLGELVARVEERYKCRFIDPTAKFRSGMQMDQLDADDRKALYRQTLSLLENGQIQMISFQGGLYRIKAGTTVPIKIISFTREVIQVAVSGSSDIAESIIQDCAEYIWDATGEPRQWSAIEAEHQLTRYATSTEIELPFSFELLLNPSFYGFLQSANDEANDYCIGMLPIQHHRPEKKNDRKPAVSIALDKMYFQIRLFDVQTGITENAKLEIEVMTATGYGSGIVTITTLLPYQTHMDFVNAFIETIEETQVT
ncbi:hypothetical protein LC092_15335 [Stappia stellulata]|uniref:hypothetical protein n=1 Tax=Stappia TaxID=152161 RepID=UPI001CD2144F|nr:hypothetical protein [Stappia stellulata]MCA1243821.1 hypothetical protein [Stappia stellulata]